MKTETIKGPAFSPSLRTPDTLAAFWIHQANMRLRREICWLRHERGMNPESDTCVLPPFMERASEGLGLARHWEKKQKFFQEEPTARYLTEQLNNAPPDIDMKHAGRGLGFVAASLALESESLFVMGLCLLAAFDNAAGSVIATCLNDPTRTLPNLALAQRLWNSPDGMLSLAEPTHPLFRYGLVRQAHDRSALRPSVDWEAPLAIPILVAKHLLFPGSGLPGFLRRVQPGSSGAGAAPSDIALIVSRIAASSHERLRIVPIRAPKGACHSETAAEIAKRANREILQYSGDEGPLDSHRIHALFTLCWLHGMDLYLDHETICNQGRGGSDAEPHALPMPPVPITLYLGISERSQLLCIPEKHLLPIVDLPGFTYHERSEYWETALAEKGRGIGPAVKECARRFRYEKKSIDDICKGLRNLPEKITGELMIQACHNEMELDLGDLAQRVTPRFEDKELILPKKQRIQFEELVKAMTSLTEVHYGWGTAKAWNESGISALFAGPPGTGKTMAAEVLARRLDLPIFRIDLSQVVNKYIGETEKNLKRLFDTADISDMILFFDEADSLFGRRTEVKDAHDRYANLEISYLLERMERFKGLAILATNRKKDLDEAFLRRLRYIIDFSLPGPDLRKEIWKQMIPENVDSSKIDFNFLAGHFPLVGGYIRSIVFNACLQSANGAGPGRKKGKRALSMEQLIISIKREYDKLNRSISLEHFGPYSAIVEQIRDERE